jgi:hypothetical protein
MPEDTDTTNEEDDTLDLEGDGDKYTMSTRTRWEWTGTLLAFAMVLSLPAIVGLTAAGVLSVGVITQGRFTLYATVTLMAATWAFGKETLEAVREARGKSGNN